MLMRCLHTLRYVHFGVTLFALREQRLVRTGNPLRYARTGSNPVDCRLVDKTAGLRGNTTCDNYYTSYFTDTHSAAAR